MQDRTAKYLSSIHTNLFRLTRGVIGRRLVANDMLLLTTVGRKTGRRHTVPLLYLRDGSSYVVIASWGGRDYPPDWYLNLRAAGHGFVQIESRKVKVSARDASEEERLRWWPKVLEAYDGYAVYQSRTERPIPVVFLEPQP